MATPASKALISEEKIRKSIRRIAKQIDRYAGARHVQELAVVCVMDGAFIFCDDLVRQMKTCTILFFTRAQSYLGTRKGPTRLSPMSSRIRGRSVLVVDTIFVSGKTLRKVIGEVRRHTSRIALAVLVEKQGKARLADLPADIDTFVGIRLPGDPFLVGYGLDCDGRHRELRDIRTYQDGSHPAAKPDAKKPPPK
jgi:hypoxanthine phosphoribosyltransferase